MSIDIKTIRERFPALKRQVVYLDNPGGTQIVQDSIDQINNYLIECNSNFHGVFASSRESDAIIDEARQAAADFLNAKSPQEIVFGANMTSLTFHISRSLARTWKSGDKILLTRLEHDANITPWVMAAEERGCSISYVDFDPEDGTLNMEELEAALLEEPVLVAIGYASNALGTINPVKEIVSMAHRAGALVYVDAVQYAPHSPIDVQSLGCDFLVFSSYKIFGPHVGVLYGRYDLLDSLPAYKVRPASDLPPEKFETGTKNHEGIAGLLGTFEYLEWLGENFGEEFADQYRPVFNGRKLNLKCAMAAVRKYEHGINQIVLDTLEETPGVTLYGPRELTHIEQRVPTFGFRVKDVDPRTISEKLDKYGIFTWSGNYYALSVTERLGVEEKGGMVRVGAVHYNTADEITRFGKALAEIVTSLV
jgi:cysteine desulfurase family protein (TIGR01976 family)